MTTLTSHGRDSFDKADKLLVSKVLYLVDVSCGVPLSPVVAFLVALHQNKELLGPDGLLPIPQYLSLLRQHFKVSHIRHTQCEHTCIHLYMLQSCYALLVGALCSRQFCHRYPVTSRYSQPCSQAFTAVQFLIAYCK